MGFPDICARGNYPDKGEALILTLPHSFWGKAFWGFFDLDVAIRPYNVNIFNSITVYLS
jgi:hypothetical protein